MVVKGLGELSALISMSLLAAGPRLSVASREPNDDRGMEAIVDSSLFLHQI